MTESIREFLTLIPRFDRVLGPQDQRTIALRQVLTTILKDVGLTELIDEEDGLEAWSAALTDFAVSTAEQLLAASVSTCDPTDHALLEARDRLAFWLIEAGRVDAAMEQLNLLLREYASVLGSDHHWTKRVRDELEVLSLATSITQDISRVWNPRLAAFEPLSDEIRGIAIAHALAKGWVIPDPSMHVLLDSARNLLTSLRECDVTYGDE
jgi:hypothetical protein